MTDPTRKCCDTCNYFEPYRSNYRKLTGYDGCCMFGSNRYDDLPCKKTECCPHWEEMQPSPKIEPSDDDFGTVLNCAVRYALGRRSYMPYLVTSYITPLLPHLSNKTIWCFKRDLESCTDFGDTEIDEPQWRKFQIAVTLEDQRRNNDIRG